MKGVKGIEFFSLILFYTETQTHIQNILAPKLGTFLTQLQQIPLNFTGLPYSLCINHNSPNSVPPHMYQHKKFINFQDGIKNVCQCVNTCVCACKIEREREREDFLVSTRNTN